MPRVDIQPQSSQGSQVISMVALNDEETMRKKRRQGRKRRRRPQLMMHEEWYGNDDHQTHYLPEKVIEKFRPSDPLNGEWEHKSNSYQSIAINSPTYDNERYRDYTGSNDWVREPNGHIQKDLPKSNFEVKNEDFLLEVDPPHPLYKVESHEILQSGYEQSNDSEQKKANDHKSYRKPYSLKKQEEQRLAASAEFNPASQLKSLLKQSGGLSLSEVLQQKNLSLSDLLKGKQMALAALVQNPNSKVAGDTNSEDETKTKQTTTTIATTTNTENVNLESETESSIQREQKEYRMRNYIRPKKKPIRVVESSTDDDDIRPTRRVPFPTRQKLKEDTSNSNFVEELGVFKDDETRIFPSVETKQMALNPVVPVHRERLDRRPIKNVIPKIRPDFSNSKVIKTEEGIDTGKRRKLNQTSTSSPSSTPKERERERWTPSSNNRERLPSRIPYRATSKQIEESGENPITTTSTLKTPQRERATIASASTTPKNIDVIRNRLSVKPRIRLPSRSGIRVKITTTSSTLAPSIYPVTTEQTVLGTTKSIAENEEVVTSKLEESDVNIIEKFTSFEDTKPKDVESIEKLFPSRERMPSSRIQKIQQKSRSSTPTIVSSTWFSTSTTTTTTKLPITLKETEISEVIESHSNLESVEADIESEKNEIIQLLEDRRNGYKLNKVLEQRNMTIDELMEHRQRGSSHVHLQELLKTKRKLAEKAKMEDRVDIVTAFENFPRFNIGNLKSIQPDDIKTDSQGFSYFTSIINIRPTDEIYKEARALQDIHKITKTSNRQFKTLKFEGENTETKSIEIEDAKESIFPDTVLLEKIEEELIRATDIESELARPNILIETTQISNGVKSAIIVSSCIVVVAIILFLFVFGLYRWRERRKNKLNYTESYKIAKGRLPIIHKEPLKDNRLSPILCAKHRHSNGRISRMNTMDPNSSKIHDYLGWDHLKKPFQ